MRHEPSATILYRPVDQQELDLIAALGWLAFPEHLPEHSVFYPVLHEEHIAPTVRGAHTPSDGVGYMLRVAVEAEYAAQFPIRNEDGRGLEALQVPAEELVEFNRHILGQIEVVSLFHCE